jgi:membrane-associated phospholipid phosphatase
MLIRNCSQLALVAMLILSLSPSRVHADVGDVASYIGNDLASPVITDAWIPFAIGSGITLALFATKSETSHPFQEKITRNRPLDKYAKFGDWAGKMYPNMIYTGAALLSAAFGHERGLVRAEEMALSSIYSGSVAALMKITFQEGRPNNPVDRKSFPSGHATTAFAFAGIVGAEHGVWAAIPAYIIATNTAYSRINDNKHYLHDVVGGATVGLSYALGIYYIRKEREAAKAAGRPIRSVPMLAVVPAPDLNGGMVGGMLSF